MNRYLLATIWTTIVVVLDQVTKVWASSTFELWSGQVVIPGFFNLVHYLNRGAAWGFLGSAAIDWQRPLFIAITFVALGLIGFMLKSTDNADKWMINGLGLIAGGAVGNLIDRIHIGAVVDFLDFYVGAYHWPAFNIADCALTIGTGCILLSMHLNRNKKEA